MRFSTALTHIHCKSTMCSTQPTAVVMVFAFSLLLQTNGQVLTLGASLTSMNYKLVTGGLIPISGTTVVRPTLSGSLIRCASECRGLNSLCTSFVFTSSAPCRKETPAGIGVCQLMSFSDPHDIILGPATDCQRFYVVDLCSLNGSNPCQNFEKCYMSRWPYVNCTCPIGYGGARCENSECNLFTSSVMFINHDTNANEPFSARPTRLFRWLCNIVI